MDTRDKIISVPDAAHLAAGAIVVSGYFDPLLAWHAVRLKEIRKDVRHIVIVIEKPPHPILPARARAELAASLATVDYVVECPEGVAVDVRLEAEERAKLAELIAQVHVRCASQNGKASESR